MEAQKIGSPLNSNNITNLHEKVFQSVYNNNVLIITHGYPSKCNISKPIQQHKHAKYRTYIILSTYMNNVQFYKYEYRKLYQVVGPLKEPKLKLLVYNNVAPDPIVMSKCDNQHHLDVDT